MTGNAAWNEESISRLKYAMKITTWTKFAGHLQLDVRRVVELLEGQVPSAEEHQKLDLALENASPEVKRLFGKPEPGRFGAGGFPGSGGPIPELAQDAALAFGAFGGAKGIAAIFKAYFDRNNVKKVKFGDDGQIVEATGLSSDEIVRLLEAADDSDPDQAGTD